MMIFLQFFAGVIICASFCILVNIPLKTIIPASLAGGFSWFVYNFLMSAGYSKSLAVFVAVFIIAVISDILAHKLKDAATVFLIPCILPLVPGSRIYYTMFYIINSDLDAAGQMAREALAIAGSIALAILIANSFSRLATKVKQRVL